MVPFRSAEGRAKLTIGALMTLAGLLAVDLLFAGARLAGLATFGEADLEEGAAPMVIFFIVYALAIAAVNIFTIIIFLMWVNRSHWNLRALLSGWFEFSPGWAVGYYFIPILNLFRPYQTMCELYAASTAAAAGRGLEGSRWRDAPVPSLLGHWWAMWIIGNVIERCGSRADQFNQNGNFSVILGIVGSLLAIGAALALIKIIRHITTSQEQAFAGGAWGAQQPPGYAYGGQPWPQQYDPAMPPPPSPQQQWAPPPAPPQQQWTPPPAPPQQQEPLPPPPPQQ